MDTTEAADLARIILDDSEADRPMDLYTLNVHEARTLAHAALAAGRIERLADRLFDAEADPMVSRGGVFISRTGAANLIRAALNGETDD